MTLAKATADNYAPDEDRPLAGYTAAMAVYGVTAVAFVALAKWRGVKLPKRIEPYDLAIVAIATHKLSRLITKDAITSPLRAPFARYVEPAGDGEVNEEV